MAALSLPTDYPRIRQVGSFDELISTPFGDGVNALCWPRTLTGDFSEVVRHLALDDDLTTLDEEILLALPLSEAGQIAVAILLRDLRSLRDLELDPVLNAITAYPRDEEPGAIPVDVYSFHADSAPVVAETWLCTYHGAPSEGLRNDEGIRRLALPGMREILLAEYGGTDDEGFTDYLSEHCYDLHYAPLPAAQPFSFGVGHLWRIAVDYPGSPVPPCLHRAPESLPGDLVRLLLIS
ncbi:MAG: hypothetical protein NWT04_16585 [Verrucomicrobiales bacterium]|nr:hypothetical protein [Verrucomicrobiales bacterium]MDP4793517.1 hypothetical protein [Verrucomicrobiales bacterium]MDP5006005.1 hypothetical protein [Verrucomicrobiales bacterium]